MYNTQIRNGNKVYHSNTNRELAIKNKMDHEVTITTVPVNMIHFADYQRTPNPTQVKAIVDNFDPHRTSPIELSYRDGVYWCFDGQHRTAAYKTIGLKSILAQVHYGLTYEDEAYLFAQQNVNKRNISTTDNWNAKLESGNRSPETQEIIRICNDFGFKVEPSAPGFKPHSKTIRCVNEIQKTYKKFGVNGLKTCLWLIQAFNGAPSGTHIEIISGINRIMETYKLSDKAYDRLWAKLSKTRPEIILVESKTVADRGGKAVAKYLVKMYNNGIKLSENRLDVNKIK